MIWPHTLELKTLSDLPNLTLEFLPAGHAQEFLDVWAAQGRVGQRGAGDDRGKRDCVLGKASEELDVDTMHDCHDLSCSFMMN